MVASSSVLESCWVWVTGVGLVGRFALGALGEWVVEGDGLWRLVDRLRGLRVR